MVHTQKTFHISNCRHAFRLPSWLLSNILVLQLCMISLLFCLWKFIFPRFHFISLSLNSLFKYNLPGHPDRWKKWVAGGTAVSLYLRTPKLTGAGSLERGCSNGEEDWPWSWLVLTLNTSTAISSLWALVSCSAILRSYHWPHMIVKSERNSVCKGQAGSGHATGGSGAQSCAARNWRAAAWLTSRVTNRRRVTWARGASTSFSDVWDTYDISWL